MFARYDSNGNQTHRCRTVPWWKNMAAVWEKISHHRVFRERTKKKWAKVKSSFSAPSCLGEDAPCFPICTLREYKANGHKKKRKKTYIFNAFSKVMSIWGQVSAQYSPPTSKMMRGGWCKSYNCCSVSLWELARRSCKGGDEEERQIDRLGDKQQKKCLEETIEEKYLHELYFNLPLMHSCLSSDELFMQFICFYT